MESEKFECKHLIYKLELGETLESVCARYGWSFEHLCKTNKITNAVCGDRIIVDASVKIHIVKPRETLSSIAEKYETTVESLKEKNNCETVFLGQQLFV